MLLAVEASTSAGTVALFEGTRLVGERTVAMKGANEERLMPAVVDLVTGAGRWSAIDRIVLGGGPGSFTSLRIAAAIGKGLATSLGVTLWSVSSLALIVAQTERPAAGRYAAVLDALRGEYFVALVDVGAGGEVVTVGGAARVPVASLPDLAARSGARVAGPVGSTEMPWAPHARGAARLVAQGHAEPVDLAAWEPAYGRLAEAQVKWEAAHGRALGSGPA